VRKNKQATIDLAEQAARWVEVIVNAVQEVQNDLPKLQSLEASVKGVLR
jgi:hypothetical protein